MKSPKWAGSVCKTWRHWRTVWRSQWRAIWTMRSAFCRSRGATCSYMICASGLWLVAGTDRLRIAYEHFAVLMYACYVPCIAFAWRWTWTWARARSTRLCTRSQRPSSAPSARRTSPSAPRAPNAPALGAYLVVLPPPLRLAPLPSPHLPSPTREFLLGPLGCSTLLTRSPILPTLLQPVTKGLCWHAGPITLRDYLSSSLYSFLCSTVTVLLYLTTHLRTNYKVTLVSFYWPQRKNQKFNESDNILHWNILDYNILPRYLTRGNFCTSSGQRTIISSAMWE